MNLFQNLSSIKKLRMGPMELAIICVVIAVIAIPFFINKSKNRKNQPQEIKEYQPKVKAAKTQKYKEEYQGGPSYYLIFSVILVLLGIIGTIAAFALAGFTWWVAAPIAMIAVGALFFYINNKNNKD